MQHIAPKGSYTRSYNYNDDNNQLQSTVVGTATYSYGYDARGNINSMPHLSAMSYNTANCQGMTALGVGNGRVMYQIC